MPVENYISLTQLTSEIRDVLTSAFRNKSYWVLADVTDHKFYAQKGCHYFSLTEKDSVNHSIKAKVDAVAWKDGGGISIESFERITGQKFKSDINVMVNVSVTYHQSYGLKLTLNDIDTTYTLGQLEQQRQQTLYRLATECSAYVQRVGNTYITANKELELPKVIQRVAVVTSSNSAGYRDFKDTIEKNKYGYKLILDSFYTTVQGEANSEAVYKRLLDVHSSGIAYDAVVIIRGGGSQTDLLIFDQFNLGMIVAKFPIPVITGIGHHTNESVVDLMAHTATKTPSIAAEFIITHNKGFEDEITTMQKTIIIKSQSLFNGRQKQLAQLNQTLVGSTMRLIQANKDVILKAYQSTVNQSRDILFGRRSSLNEMSGRVTSKPKIIVGNRINDLANIISNIKSFKDGYLRNQRGYLNHYVSICRMMSPANILKKGFAIIYANDEIVTNADKIQANSLIKVRLADSELQATVKSKNTTNGSEFDL